jgi:hypothetical protein
VLVARSSHKIFLGRYFGDLVIGEHDRLSGFGFCLCSPEFLQQSGDGRSGVRKLGKICVHNFVVTNDRCPSVHQLSRTLKRTTVVGQSKKWTPYCTNDSPVCMTRLTTHLLYRYDSLRPPVLLLPVLLSCL